MAHLATYQISSPSSDFEEDSEFYDTVSDGKIIVYTCKAPNCKKAFRFRSEIQRHLTTHSALRPHNCKYPNCNKSFKRKDALQNHMRTHTNEKPYACSSSNCKMKFATRAGLRYHLLKHQGEKVFKCSNLDCEAEFYTLAQLNKHEASKVHCKSGSDNSSEDSQYYSEEKSSPSQFDMPEVKEEEYGTKSSAVSGLMKIFRENELLRRKVEENERLIAFLQNSKPSLNFNQTYEMNETNDLFAIQDVEQQDMFYGYNY